MIFDCNFWAVVKVELARNDDGSICEKDTIASLEAVVDSAAKANELADRWSMVGRLDDGISYHEISLRNAKARWWQDIEDWACQAGKLAALGVTS